MQIILGWHKTLWISIDPFTIFPKILTNYFPNMTQIYMVPLKIMSKKNAIRLMNVQHEDVICRIFLYTFENKASTWYFNLPIRSIHNWSEFQTKFLDKFGEDKTPRDLIAEPFAFSMGPNERVLGTNYL